MVDGQAPNNADNMGVAAAAEFNDWAMPIVDDPTPYLLFPQEKFQATAAGILSSTATDGHGLTLAAEHMRRFAAQIMARPFWLYSQHDPATQAIGRLLVARVIEDKEAGLHVLAGVMGLYEPSSLPRLSDVTRGTSGDAAIADAIDEPMGAGPVRVGFSPDEIPVDLVEAALSERPQIVSESWVRQYRKAADPITVLEVFVGAWLLLSNPFSKKVLERLGTEAGDEAAKSAAEFYAWLKGKLLASVSALSGERRRFVVTTKYRGVRVRYVVSTFAADAASAVDVLRNVGTTTFPVVDSLLPLGPMTVTFVFDPRTGEWVAKHATTSSRGVLCDAPAPFDPKEFKALSISFSEAGDISDDDDDDGALSPVEGRATDSTILPRGWLTAGEQTLVDAIHTEFASMGRWPDTGRLAANLMEKHGLSLREMRHRVACLVHGEDTETGKGETHLTFPGLVVAADGHARRSHLRVLLRGMQSLGKLRVDAAKRVELTGAEARWCKVFCV